MTGGSRGIGRAVCQQLAAMGAVVIVNYVSQPDAAEQTVAGIIKAGGRAEAVTLPGKTHFTADYECGMPGDEGDTGKILLRFIQDATSSE